MFHFVQPAAFESSTPVPFSAMPSRHYHHRPAASASPFGAITTSVPADFDSFEEYDEYRSRQELEALIRQQEQRRLREAAVLLARRQQEAEQIRQQALLRAQHEEQQRAKYQALLEQQAALLEQLRQQEEMKMSVQLETERRQAVEKAQQQQQQPQQQCCLRNSSHSTSQPCPAARRRRQPLEHLAGLCRNRQDEVQHPFAPFFRLLFDSEQDEQEEVPQPSPAQPAQAAEPATQQVEAAQPAASAAPVAQPVSSEAQTTESKAEKQEANKAREEAPVESVEDVLGSLFKSLFGVDVKLSVRKGAEPPAEAQEPTTKREQSSTAPKAENMAQAPVESPSVDVQAFDPAEVPVEAAQEKEVASAEQESAAEKLQRHYQAHLQRRKALASLSTLSAQFEARRSSFAVPQSLEFQPSPPSSEHADSTPNDVAPKLAYKSSNAPFLAYEDFLVNLLSKIDEVQSGGDRTIKSARKTLVKQIEAELKKLDQARDEAWEKVSSQPQPEKVSDDNDDDEPLEPLLAAAEDTTAAAADSAQSAEAAAATSEVAPLAATSTSEDASSTAPAPTTESTQPKDESKVEEKVEESSDPTDTAAQATQPELEPQVAVQPPVSIPAPEPIRLTPEALAKLSSHAERRRRHRVDDDDSSSSTTTISEATLEIEEALGAILNQARKLGEQVELHGARQSLRGTSEVL
ncbi:BQ2448_6779 [Microbotryum intermedium]|uniref:BQ2448_6779 protein n=1 Tax=Microbotryum intermedium TaxID=269621 RepID=A0A238FM44_9BASI|nr:BQ2448_6779 [Microbotryum intermedium]